MEDRATRRNRARTLKLNWRNLPRRAVSKNHDQIYIPVPHRVEDAPALALKVE